MADKTVKKAAKKEFTTRTKRLRKQAQKAGVNGKDFSRQIKQMDRMMTEAAKEEKKYLDARESIQKVHETVDRLYEDCYAAETQLVRIDLDNIKSLLKRAAKNWFSSQESQWRQALVRMDDAGQMFLQPGRIRPAKDPAAEDLRVLAMAFKERLEECIPTEVPDFYEKAEQVVGVKSNMMKAIQENDKEYIDRKENMLSQLGTVEILLDSSRLNKKSIRQAIKGLLPRLTASIDPLDLPIPETEEELKEKPESVDIPGLPARLLAIVKRYFPALKSNTKKQKKYDKAKAKYDKKAAKGKSAVEPAQPDLVDLEAIKDEMRDEMKQVSSVLSYDLNRLKNKDTEQAVDILLKHLEKLALERLG